MTTPTMITMRRVLRVPRGEVPRHVDKALARGISEIEERDDLTAGTVEEHVERIAHHQEYDARAAWEAAETLDQRLRLIAYLLGLAPTPDES